MRGLRGNKISMIFQEPMSSLNPVYTIGQQLTEILHLHNKMSGAEAMERAARAARGSAHPRAGRRVSSSIRTSSPAASASA